MAKSHKDQHWIPKSYLLAWADLDETDLYTIKLPDGGRDLRLEHGLSDLEKAFSSLRKDFLAKRRQLPAARHAKLLVFVAALRSRTPAIRDHHLKSRSALHSSSVQWRPTCDARAMPET
jgi:hypothetical protein